MSSGIGWSGWRRLELLVLPAEFRDDLRAMFIVRLWAFGCLLALPLAGVALHQRGWPLLAAHLCVPLSTFAGAVVLWRTRRIESSIRVTLVMLVVPLFGAGLLQNPYNPLAATFLMLLPMTASFSLPRREALWWLVACMVLVGVNEALGAAGYHLDGPARARLPVVMAINAAALLVVVWSMTSWFIELHRHVRERLERSGQAKDTFLANMSHELRTPMNGVLGLTEVLLGTPLRADQRELLELVARSGKSLVTLLNDLLDLSRIEHGRLEVQRQPTEVRALAHDVVLLFTSLARSKGLEVECSVSAALPATVMLDGLRVRQVLANLISNAVKFTDHGTVSLSVDARPLLDGRTLSIEFAVRDTGIGISEAVMPRLFQAFEQGDASSTRRFGGTGLGLALCQKLVMLMGGAPIHVTSVRGQGTTFSFSVAAEVTTVSPVEEETAELAAWPAGRLPVLVVDDNAINLRVAQGLVEQQGYRVVTATNGLEALAALRLESFGLVLMDCHMPEMDGFEATREIRAQEHTRSLPVVALTASALKHELDACHAAGMNDCLIKPLSLDALKAALALGHLAIAPA